MSRALFTAALVIVAGCASDDAAAPETTAPVTSSPTMSSTTAVPTTTTSGVTPTGFDPVAGEVTAADGEVCAVCLWVAGTPEQRSRGLMGVTDMGGANGMVFLFEGESTSAFWMRDTPTPLSIAFFDAAGAFVSATDMEPCLEAAAEVCPRYHADGAYTSAIEVRQGDLGELLIGPGSRFELLDTPCEPGR